MAWALLIGWIKAETGSPGRNYNQNIDLKIHMKINNKSTGVGLLAVIALVVGGFTAQVHAEDHKFGDHDKTGYWDANQQHHAYVVHNNHRGYWDQRSGTRIWVNID